MTKLRFISAVYPTFLATIVFAEASGGTENMPPIREITVFKDGHAFVLHEGRVPTDADGNVTMDYVPTPVLGTFWPYSAEDGAKLKGVVAGRSEVTKERAVSDLEGLLRANPGAEVLVGTVPYGQEKVTPFAATLTSMPAPPDEAPTATPVGIPLGSSATTPARVVLLKTPEGTKAVRPDRILEVTFRNEYKTTTARKQFQNRLTLQFDWPNDQRPKEAAVGMAYLQKGLRWIPNYRLDLDGEGHAAVKMQATLINELADLHDVTVHLVVGVPKIAFEDNVDPISLQKIAAQVASQMSSGYRTPYAFPNAIMTQTVMPPRGAFEPADGSADTLPDLGPNVSTEKKEDLFVFSLKGITLKKGERMVVPVSEFQVTYKDVYRLDLPFSPPAEVRCNLDTTRQLELAKAMLVRTMHVIRIQNTGTSPLTTAPVLVLSKGRVLSQALMTYAPAGAQSDLEIATAVGVSHIKEESETKRTADAVSWNRNEYMRVDLDGSITIRNQTSKIIDLEVRREVLGTPDSADKDGQIRKMSALDDEEFLSSLPPWWSAYSWPGYWNHLNGVGRLSWTLHVDAGQEQKVTYKWHYFWRP